MRNQFRRSVPLCAVLLLACAGIPTPRPEAAFGGEPNREVERTSERGQSTDGKCTSDLWRNDPFLAEMCSLLETYVLTARKKQKVARSLGVAAVVGGIYLSALENQESESAPVLALGIALLGGVGRELKFEEQAKEAKICARTLRTHLGIFWDKWSRTAAERSGTEENEILEDKKDLRTVLLQLNCPL